MLIVNVSKHVELCCYYKCIIVEIIYYFDYLCLFAAGSDLLLPDGPNGTTARLVFNRSQTSNSFDIQVPCDGLVEGLNQRCTLMFGAVTIPDSARNILVASPGREVNLTIRECDDDCELCTIPVKYTYITFHLALLSIKHMFICNACCNIFLIGVSLNGDFVCL